MKQLILYSRSYCHLCHDMEVAVQAYQTRFAFALSVQDVDADPAALALYDELVPVLLVRQSDGQLAEICHYHLDEARLLAVLAVTGE